MTKLEQQGENTNTIQYKNMEREKIGHLKSGFLDVRDHFGGGGGWFRLCQDIEGTVNCGLHVFWQRERRTEGPLA